MDGSLIRRCAVLLLAAAQLLAPLLLFLGNFNDQTAKPPLTAAPNPATPAGYAFAIWGVIYIGALAYAVYQALPSNAHDQLLERIGWPTAAGYALCIGWLLAARFGPGWMTVPIIFGMLLCLTSALLVVARWHEPMGTTRQVLVAAPLGLYVGWLSAAAFVNAADVLPGYGFDRFGLSPQAFGCLVVIAAGVLASAIALATSAYLPYIAAVMWALVAIIMNSGLPQRGNLVSTSAAVAAMLLAGLAASLWLPSLRARGLV